MTKEQWIEDIRGMIQELGLKYIPSRQEIGWYLSLSHMYKIDKVGLDTLEEAIRLPRKIDLPRSKWIKIPKEPRQSEIEKDMKAIKKIMKELKIEYFPKQDQIKPSTLSNKLQCNGAYTNMLAKKLGVLRYRQYIKLHGKPKETKKEEKNMWFDEKENLRKKEAEKRYLQQCQEGEVKTITGEEAQKYIEKYSNTKEEKIPSMLNVLACSTKGKINIAVVQEIIRLLERGKSKEWICRKKKIDMDKLDRFLARSRSYRELKTSKAI
ncbi:hypothetical protein [Anaerophilus nitritogenes]|uniref:hypothetical protein n=1 Tax=Anaerophilus nitritogenes TaxID=2498136 RepID=UPI00101C7723|nr:hypothetical protein [Anaerophilus nitritogenes]